MKSVPSLERQISELPKLDRASLEKVYRRLHGKACSPRDSKEFLRISIAYRLQRQLTARLRSRMYQALTAAEAISSLVIEGSRNTILLREWKGAIHEVTLMDDEVSYDGNRYDSLSEVAHVITGGKRSVAEFFGVQSDKQKAGARHGRA